jgi:hypothetical protein
MNMMCTYYASHETYIRKKEGDKCSSTGMKEELQSVNYFFGEKWPPGDTVF